MILHSMKYKGIFIYYVIVKSVPTMPRKSHLSLKVNNQSFIQLVDGIQINANFRKDNAKSMSYE